jgi:preprotein translocase subunit SecG
MITSLMIFHAIVSCLLILLVLLQFGKGAEAGLMGGGGGSDSVLTSSQRGNVLSKITVVLAILFLSNSILLAKLQGQKQGTSILDGEAPVAQPLNNDAAEAAVEKAAAGATTDTRDVESNTVTPKNK